MRVSSSKPKGQRIKKTTRGKHRPFWIEPVPSKDIWWFCIELDDWCRGEEDLSRCERCSSYYYVAHYGLNNIHSLKAAKRKIAKWNVPKGTKFKVMLPWVGHEFIITK